MQQKVIVVGAGPVGLTAALGLARAGVEVTVLDRADEIRSAPRAMAHLYPVLEFFDRLDLLEDIEEAGFRVEQLTFLDWETGEGIPSRMSALEGHVPRAYNISLGQDRITEIIMRHLRRRPEAAIRTGAEVVDVRQDGTSVTVELATGELLGADWVIGGDGANSIVRRALGLTFDGSTWPERFVAVDIRFDYAAGGYDSANFVIHPKYGGIVARIAGDLWRYTYHEPPTLPDDGVRDRLDGFLKEALPGPDRSFELVRFAPYRMHQRAANTFRSGRALLAGDAAHITNPIGGLGLSGGFIDAFLLSQALAAVIHGEAEESVLDDYSRQRRRVFLDYVSPTATENKNLVFHLPDRQRSAVLAALRATSADPEATRAVLLRMRSMVTPSLLRARPAAPEPTEPSPL